MAAWKKAQIKLKMQNNRAILHRFYNIRHLHEHFCVITANKGEFTLRIARLYTVILLQSCTGFSLKWRSAEMRTRLRSRSDVMTHAGEAAAGCTEGL